MGNIMGNIKIINGIWLVSLILFIVSLWLLKNRNNNSRVDDIIKTLVRQSARWTTAARQDNNPYIAVLHANYGAGYLWALKDFATSQEIERAGGVDPIKFEREITSTQDYVSRNLLKICKESGPDPSYLTAIAGEG